MQLTFSEENYLKAIFKLKEKEVKKITTNAIASSVNSTPASVTDMIQRLHEKKLLNYAPYQGVSLTLQGKKSAISVIRKHRLWELFLVTKLGFNWDQVHEIAEQLEHIQSEELVKKLNIYLGKPKWDPHGDPIPDENGNFHTQKTIPLTEASIKFSYKFSGVSDHSSDFLKYLDKNGFSIDKKIVVKQHTTYDGSMSVLVGSSTSVKHISAIIAKNILVTQQSKKSVQ